MRYEIRELNVGGILDQAIKLVKDNFWTFLKVMLVLSIPFGIVSKWLIQSSAAENAVVMQQEMLGKSGEGVFFRTSGGSPGLAMLLGLIQLLVVVPLTDAAIIYSVGSFYLGKPIGVGGAYRRAGSVYLKYLWTGFLWGLCLMGLGIVAGIVVGASALLGPLVMVFALIAVGILFLIVLVWFGLCTRAVVFDGLSGSKALNRSKQLIQGSMATAAILWFVLVVIGALCSLAIMQFVRQLELNVILQVIVETIMAIFTSAAITVLYFSCRCKKENFDLRMLADAVSADNPQTANP